jgi:Putative auto-transporter adhesin, head GIN domain
MQTGKPNQFKSFFAHCFFTIFFVSALVVGGTSCQGASDVSISTGCIQGSGVLNSEARDLPAFHALDIDGAFSVKIDCQKKQSLTLSADDNLLPLIVTDVSGGTLRITTRKPICTSLPLTVSITVETLDHIRSGGANDFIVKDVSVPSLDLTISGSGDMEVSGRTENLNITLEGASEIHAGNLKANEVNVSIEGAGSAEVFADTQLNASITGVGEIHYAGKPKKVVRNITGWGEVIPIER